MLKLLTRLYDVSSGSVALNGVDVRDLKLEVRLDLRASSASPRSQTASFIAGQCVATQT